MTRVIMMIALVLLAGIGCSEDQNPVRQYGNTLTESLKKAEKAKVVADLMTIKAEIVRYKAERGAFPPDLEALNLKDIHPQLYTYDSETGAVSLAE